MLNELLRFSQQNAFGVALLGAHFIFYAAPAWLVLTGRLCSLKMKPRERILAGAWLLCLALEFVQFSYSRGNDLSDVWGLPRYVGTFAPLLWAWLAGALAFAWKRHWVGKLLVVTAAAALVWGITVPEYRRAFDQPTRADVESAATRIERTIRHDYAGPRRQGEVRPTANDYITANRPVVFSEFGYAAWLLRGQSEGAIPGKGASPYPDDYLFFRTATGYAGRKAVDPRQYDFVKKIRSALGYEWQLYRRKGTPHR